MSRLDEIRERHAARLRTRAAKGDGAVQMSTLVDDDVAWLLAEVEHWKSHAEEAGAGFARVCRDYARATAGVRRVMSLVIAAEERSPLGAKYEEFHPDEPAALLIPVRDVRAALDASSTEVTP